MREISKAQPDDAFDQAMKDFKSVEGEILRRITSVIEEAIKESEVSDRPRLLIAIDAAKEAYNAFGSL